MTSRAGRTRRRKAAAAIAATEVAAAPSIAPGARAQTVVHPPTRREAGLDMLHARGRLTSAQAHAGNLYGMLERTARIEGAASIRSSMADPSGSGGGGYLFPAGGEDLFAAEWIASCRARLLSARAALLFHTEKIAVVDLICARGMHPREISAVQREAEQIETVLRVALDDLASHFRSEALDAQRKKDLARLI